jgi:hypothetical protein
MALKPIDLQVMMPRVSEASRVQNNQQQRNHAIQQSTVQSMDKQVDDNLKQVRSREEAHQIAIRERQERERRQSKQDGKDAESGEEREKGKKQDHKATPGRTIDIRL